MFRLLRRPALACLFILLLSGTFAAGQAPEIHGVVTDVSGVVVPEAQVDLLQQGRIAASSTTDREGRYSLHVTPGVAYQLRAHSTALQTRNSVEALAPASGSIGVNLQLALPELVQQVTVTATGVATTQGQLGSAVTVLPEQDYAQVREVQQALRIVPGLQVVQTGQAGGTTSLFIRGGNSNANKVLIDGVPLNDIGGQVEFANIAATGIAQAEVLRGPNSALFGSDALAGVVSLTTRRGTTSLPQWTYSADGGNFNSYRQAGSVGGAAHGLDYYSEFSRDDTANSVPLDRFHNGTFTGNFGWKLDEGTSLRATIRHDRIASGEPNAVALYGIASAAKQQNEDAYIGVTAENRSFDRWHNLLRYGALRLRSQFTAFAPTGIPQYDSGGTLLGYLGAPVTLRGANGYKVSGQAQYQYAGTYPNTYASSTDRDFVYAQTDYAFSPHLLGLAALKYEDERGYSGGPTNSIERGNYSYTLEVKGNVRNRLYYTAGSGIEKNHLFGIAGTPRASLAFDLLRPGSRRLFSGTKVRASFGEGIKEPNLSDETTSLYALLAALPDGAPLISRYRIPKVGPEKSRTYDGGVDQQFLDGRATLGLTYFHNEFTNGLEYIYPQGLTALGVPAEVANAAQYGATVNSQTFRAQGLEVEAEYRINPSWFARGGYTYLDAVVQRSFASDAIGPSYNPSFPTVPIGIYSPLVGARPFRRAPHTGYFGISYSRARFSGLLTGTLVGSRDDSDFLQFDASYQPTLLLPNRNLDGAYQRIDLSASYRVSQLLTLYSNVQNIASQHFSEAFGYPALPFSFRSGVRLTLGGESWKLW